MSAELLAVILCVGMALVFLLLNVKAGDVWLKWVSMAGLLGFLAIAVVIVIMAFVIPVLS